MEYKLIRVRKNTYDKLMIIAGRLQVIRGRKTSMSDAIDYLIENTRDKKMEVKF